MRSGTGCRSSRMTAIRLKPLPIRCSAKNGFLFKTLIAACLVLVTAILFRHPSASLEPARQFIARTMETEFQFAAVSAWYEKTFGEPLAFFAPKKEEKVKTASSYAVPASGRILESFEKTGRA